MSNINLSDAVGTVAALANTVDLIVDVMRAISGEEISTNVDHCDTNSSGIYEVVALKVRSELSSSI
jgi:hypothetical protein